MKKYKPKFNMGDVVVHSSSNEEPLLTVIDPDTENCSAVTVRYWNKVLGEFDERDFYTFELVLVTPSKEEIK